LAKAVEKTMPNLKETITKELFEETFQKFFFAAKEQVSEHYDKYYPSLTPGVLEFTRGRRYYKVTRNDGGSRGVHCFVDTKTGDVLKAASWSAPAKHARSNIFDSDLGLSGLTVYGGRYLR